MPGDEYRITWNGGHCEIYINGEFYCSADNMTEAANELEAYMKGIEQ